MVAIQHLEIVEIMSKGRELMKKGIVAMSVVGLGAGVIYAMEASRRGRNKDVTAHGEKVTEAVPQSGAGTGVGAARAKMEPDNASVSDQDVTSAIDDHGTDQSEAAQILQNIRDNAFDSSNEKLALALGRSADEIEQFIRGDATIDGDVLMKARSLAMHRGVDDV